MFIHNLKYSLKVLFKNKGLIFWTFVFPIILGTLFKMAFSNIENEEKLSVIDLAVIKNNEFDNDFPHLLLIDIFGGSPSNAAALLLAENYKINAVSGVNLPMLLEALTERDNTAVDILIKQLKTAGNEGIIDIVEAFSAE